MDTAADDFADWCILNDIEADWTPLDDTAMKMCVFCTGRHINIWKTKAMASAGAEINERGNDAVAKHAEGFTQLRASQQHVLEWTTRMATFYRQQKTSTPKRPTESAALFALRRKIATFLAKDNKLNECLDIFTGTCLGMPRDDAAYRSASLYVTASDDDKLTIIMDHAVSHVER